jgi:hypothetical protein
MLEIPGKAAVPGRCRWGRRNQTDAGVETMERDGAATGVEEQVPLGQRLYDNWLLLLIVGFVIMAVLYTGWGLLEIVSLPQATLP